MIVDEPRCGTCGCEESEHIKFKDAEGGYCHACWFNGDITDEEAMKRAEHLFKPKGTDAMTGGQE